MNRVVEILCRRDGISVVEATRQVRHVQNMLNSSNWGVEEVEDILMEELGLEMDYIFDLI